MVLLLLSVVFCMYGVGRQVYHDTEIKTHSGKVALFLGHTVIWSLYVFCSLSIIFKISEILKDTQWPLLVCSILLTFLQQWFDDTRQTTFYHIIDFFGYLCVYYSVLYIVTFLIIRFTNF